MSNNKANDKKPKSLRLSKAHREDIVKAVMQQWDFNNPNPLLLARRTLTEALLKRASKVLRSRGPEDWAAKLRDVFIGSIAANTALHTLPEKFRKLVTVNWYIDLRTFLATDQGTDGLLLTLTFPKALAEKYGFKDLPVETSSRNDATTLWAEYAVQVGTKTSVDLVRLPSSQQYSSPTAVIPDAWKDVAEYRKSKIDADKHQQARKDLQQEVTDYLNQFNTTGQIRENWPQIVDYLPPHLDDPDKAINLPAIPCSRLNARLGIK